MIVKNLPDWHREVCSREDYRCRICRKDFSSEYYFQEDNNGRVNQYITGHHYPHTQKARPDLVFDTENGVPLCLDCHTKTHKGLVNVPDNDQTNIVIEKKSFIKKLLKEDLTLPNGKKVYLKPNEKICECKKYIAIVTTDVCMACEKRPTNFKIERKKKK